MAIDLEKYEFQIGTVALIFFNNTAKWARYHDKQFVDKDGKPLGRRRENNRGDDRLYTLSDIREMAYILRRRGIISGEGLVNCLNRIDSMSQPVFKRKLSRSK